MKTYRFFLLFASLVLALCAGSCKKDTKVLRFQIEGNTGAKVGINDQRKPVWQNGDKINVNGQVYPLTINDQNATTEVPISDNNCYTAAYPSNMTVSGNNVTVTIPSEQDYTTVGGEQVVLAPMVGYATGNDNQLTMKNLCAVLKITVTKPDNIAEMYVNTIELTNRTENMCGTGSTDASQATPTLSLNANQSRTITLARIGCLLNAENPSKTFYVYMAPFAESTVDFKISTIAGHQHIEFKRDARFVANASEMKTVPANLAQFTRETQPEEFSVSATKKVRFSKGNLRYNVNSGDWGLAASQESYSGRTVTSDGWFEYFGWGTWGRSGTDGDPINSTVNNTDTISYPGTTEVLKSWTITLDANGSVSSVSRDDSWDASHWRLLTRSEWNYLVLQRANSFLKCRINSNGTAGNGVSGLLLFPDNYAIPQSIVNAHSNINSYINEGTARYNNTLLSAEEWSALNADGCIFLPAAGVRASTDCSNIQLNGYYWSSSPQDATDKKYAGDLEFRDNEERSEFYVKIERGQFRRLGMNIRLVQDIPSSK